MVIDGMSVSVSCASRFTDPVAFGQPVDVDVYRMKIRDSEINIRGKAEEAS